jgi:hypothetical protein
MAKQSGTVFFEGTIDDLTFYKMNGKYYVRKKSRLTGKRVKKDPQFENSMRNANLFGRSAKLASKVYRQLPKEKKGHGIISDMTAVMRQLLWSGMSEQAALARLEQLWGIVTDSNKQWGMGNAQWAINNKQGMVNGEGKSEESRSDGQLAIGKDGRLISYTSCSRDKENQQE